MISGIVEVAVARHGEDPGDHQVEEAHALALGLIEHLLAHVLEMHVGDPASMPAADFDRIGAAIVQVPRVIEQPDQRRIGIRHQPVDLRQRLHAGAHMRMVGDRHAGLLGDAADLMQAGDHRLPLGIVEHRLVRQDVDRLLVHRMAELGADEIGRADRLHVVHLVAERPDGLIPHGVAGELQAGPDAADFEAARSSARRSVAGSRGNLWPTPQPT